jgi:hypothetical protein
MRRRYLGRNRQAVAGCPGSVSSELADAERKDTHVNELVKHYLACWNETDAADRRALIEDVWAAEAHYTDPLAQVHGRDEIDATIGAVQAQFPGPRTAGRRADRDRFRRRRDR